MKFLLNLLGSLGGQTYIYLALVCGSFGAGFYVEHLRFKEFADTVRLEAQKQIDANTAKLKEQEIINENIKQTYEARLTSIHTFYSGMLNSSSSPVSSVPNATITVNGETHNILSVAEECSITTTQLITLQSWIIQQVNLDGKR
jgi:hypothetical protein